jgi:hypothetical protein
VSVQEPARKRLGTAVATPGRIDAVPGTARNVAWCSLVTTASRTFVDAARGNISASAPT